MKLLIISSEPLNPDNILSSIFELTQAAILKAIAEVCILSVSPQDTLSARMKLSFKRIKQGNDRSEKFLFNPSDRIFRTVVLKTDRTNSYLIEGIPVIEGKNYNWISRGSYHKKFRNWMSAGLSAFRQYKARFGKPDIIHAHGRFMYAGALALKIHNKSGIPFVYTEHSTAYHLGLAPKEAKSVLKDIVDRASALIIVSKPLLIDFESFLGERLPSSVILPNTVDPVFETPLSSTTNPDRFCFINISSFHPKKGLDILLKSFKLAFGADPFFHLTIAGDGPLKNDLSGLRDHLGLQEVVHFIGNISKQEVKEKLDESNVLVVSSLHETFGVVVIEALSRGCPVVSTLCGGPESIINKESGILVKLNDVDELAMALKNITSAYKVYDRKKIQEYTIAHYGSHAFLAASEKIYNSVLQKNH